MYQQQQLAETEVQCAHCGEKFRGLSQALTWSAAQAHADGHQVKSYAHAPALKPAAGIATGIEPSKRKRRRR
jgi:hypothetical protein